MVQEMYVIALAKALPLSIALTLIIALNISPYGPYAVFLHIEPMNLSYLSFDWSWPIFVTTTVLAWLVFRIFEIR
jgi:hypothetical protein